MKLRTMYRLLTCISIVGAVLFAYGYLMELGTVGEKLTAGCGGVIAVTSGIIQLMLRSEFGSRRRSR